MLFFCMMWIEMRMEYEMDFFDEVTLQKEEKKKRTAEKLLKEPFCVAQLCRNP